MSTVISRVQQFLTSEDGPTAAEYAILVALIVAALVASVPLLTKGISTTFSSVATNLSSAGT